jgi:hypothetical protein
MQEQEKLKKNQLLNKIYKIKKFENELLFFIKKMRQKVSFVEVLQRFLKKEKEKTRFSTSHY